MSVTFSSSAFTSHNDVHTSRKGRSPKLYSFLVPEKWVSLFKLKVENVKGGCLGPVNRLKRLRVKERDTIFLSLYLF